jgi:hypothetical protein
MFTLKELRAAIEGLPDDTRVVLMQDCTEGCGAGYDEPERAEVRWEVEDDRSGPALVLTDVPVCPKCGDYVRNRAIGPHACAPVST